MGMRSTAGEAVADGSMYLLYAPRVLSSIRRKLIASHDSNWRARSDASTKRIEFFMLAYGCVVYASSMRRFTSDQALRAAMRLRNASNLRRFRRIPLHRNGLPFCWVSWRAAWGMAKCVVDVASPTLLRKWFLHWIYPVHDGRRSLPPLVQQQRCPPDYHSLEISQRHNRSIQLIFGDDSYAA